MSNPTTPFSWQMPTATDLVTDLPADFEVFGQAVATSMADLLGGTSGQILAKNSNTDMDFVWIANDQGDITGITATAPLTGGGSSGAVTVGIQDALTTQKGAVQLSDSTSTTSSILAATPTAVKAAYDLADGAIAKTTVTTAGDIIYRNATVPTRLGIGTAGQVLQVNSGASAPEWATPAGGTISFTTWTPTLTNITVGNGTQVARYGTSGKFVIAQYRLTFGSTTSFGGNIRFTLPVAPAYGGFQVFGAIADDGNATYFCAAEADPTTSTVYPNVLKADSTYLSNNSIGPTTPMTWGTGDKLNIIFTYESV
jgi:hypothetical protein